MTLQREITDAEIELLINDLLEIYGYDFSNYSRVSVRRRINRLFLLDKFSDFQEFRHKVSVNPDYVSHFIKEITVNVTEMFRDPSFYEVIRNQVLPMLADCPFIRIWHAGCSTGEEVYSMAILLKEANLLGKSLLYATDINPTVLEKLRKGIFPIGYMQKFSENYISSGGKKDFSTYYTAKYDWAKLDDSLQKNMVVSTHNLASDSSFNEFQLILCRNVLIYFDRDLQNKVFDLFDQSLAPSGFLCLGAKETLNYSPVTSRFKQFDGKAKIWRKIV